ncbi:MAG: ABC transporter permease subunit [Anaerolineales bacterium]|nr:ABC transporter permease subunit [Anaerolineales bacterium]
MADSKIAPPVVEAPRRSALHGLLSLIVPGLGQFVAGARTRGLTLLVTVLTLFGLSMWTIAQRARFPEYAVVTGDYLRIVLACAALLVFLLALRHLLTRFVLKDPLAETFSLYGVVLLFFVLVMFVGDDILATVLSAESLSHIHGMTGLYSGAALAALWLWQVGDAARIGGEHLTGKRTPSMGGAIVIACLLVFALGYNLTGVNLPKAIREYQDVGILLPRILWPWRAAFAYDQEVFEVVQKIQAPCPDGATGPGSNPVLANDPWVSATPTCGDLSVRPTTGGLILGTELTITAGNFVPGQEVLIRWANPIGNPFTPRGMGETTLIIDENGGFTTTLNIPDAVVSPETASGDQIHSLIVRQESVRVFGNRLSNEMNLALIGLLETIMIGLMATFFGIVAAFPLSFLAAKNLMSPIMGTPERILGNVLGVLAGGWLGIQVTDFASASLGGLEAAPVQVFLIGMLAVLGLGIAGLQLGGRLSEAALTRLGKDGGYWVSSGVLALLAAYPGYILGLGFSRGIRSIVLGAEVAAINEEWYGALGAVLVAVLVFWYLYGKRHTRRVPVGLMLYGVVRTIFNVVRSVEALIYAIIAAIWVGLGPFAGTLALTLHTIASLAKLYSEAIESIDPGPLEALDAVGANRLQTIVYAVVPQILPPVISFTVYRWDINVRMSTLLGFVGGGGIGFILLQWIRLYQYEAVGIAVWLIAITVAALDYVSSEIRERFV